MTAFLWLALILPLLAFNINRWKVFLYYSLSILVMLHMVLYAIHVDYTNPFTDHGNGTSAAIGLLILRGVQIYVISILSIRLALFIHGATKRVQLKQDILSKQTFIAVFFSLIASFIFSNIYYHLNDPYKNVDENMRGQIFK